MTQKTKIEAALLIGPIERYRKLIKDGKWK
jgi:hypothetical protein